MEQKTKELLFNAQQVIIALSSELEESLQKNAEMKEDLKTWELVSSSEDLIAMDEVAKTIL